MLRANLFLVDSGGRKIKTNGRYAKLTFSTEIKAELALSLHPFIIKEKGNKFIKDMTPEL